MSVETERRARMRSELDRALGEDELRLHYQPIVDLHTGQRLGVEALVRWQHPDRGLLSPAEFIDQAEESGQITAIGAWVLGTACDAALQLELDAHMSINVSGRQLQQPDLVETIARALYDRDLPAHRLVLEITETAAVADIDSAIARLEELKSFGLQLALDDFGTGYSPLSYLRRFPVDYLKIDKSFVTGIAGNDEDRAIVRGVIDMAHALGLKAIAEGVEDARQRQILADLGCDLGQGFYWMAPVPLASLPGWSVPTPRGRSTHVVPVRE